MIQQIFYEKEENNTMKCADISSAFKKGDKFDKENYRPVSLLPTASKVFETIFFVSDKKLYRKLSIKLSMRFS